MLNDLSRNYKKIVVLILLLLCAILFWFFACHDQTLNKKDKVSWEKESDGKGKTYRFSCGSLSGTVIFGAKGAVPSGKTSPVSIHASAEKNFTGTVRIVIPGNDGSGIAHQTALSCKKGEETDLTMNIPQLGDASCFAFELMDSYGGVLLSETLVPGWVEEKSAIPIIYMGVLSDNYKKLSYMDGLNIDGEDEEYKLRLVAYGEEDFPETESGLTSLSGILIDHFDTSRLSPGQLKCLTDYVAGGGVLLIGTGDSGEATLSGIGETLGIKDGKKVQGLIDFAGAVSSSSRLDLTLDQFKTDDNQGWERVDISSARNAYERNLGQGSLYLTAFSFSDKPFSNWSNASAASRGLFQHMFLDQEGTMDQKLLRTWYLESILYAFLPSVTPDTFYYGMFFLFYIIMLILLGYYALRQVRRRELIWLVVPVMSIAFTGFLLFHTSHLVQPDSSSFSLMKISDDQKLEDEYYVLYQNGEGEACKVNLAPQAQSVEPVDYEYRKDIQDIPSVNGSKIDYIINKKRSNYRILFSETLPGTSRILRVKTVPEREQVFETELTTEPTTFSGKVKNVTNKKYDWVLVARGRQFVLLPEMAAGKELEINRADVRCMSNYEEDPYSFNMSGDNVKSELLNVLLYSQETWMQDRTDLDETILVGVTYDGDPGIFTDEDTMKNHISLDVNHIPDQAGKDMLVTSINHFCLRSGEDNLLRSDTLESEKTKVTYQFDRDSLVKNLYRNRDSYEGSISAYNYRTGREEVILKKWDDVLDQKELEDYLSDQNVMILTYRLPEDRLESNTPVLSVRVVPGNE